MNLSHINNTSSRNSSNNVYIDETLSEENTIGQTEKEQISQETEIELAIKEHYFKCEHGALDAIPLHILTSKRSGTELEVLFLNNNNKRAFPYIVIN